MDVAPTDRLLRAVPFESGLWTWGTAEPKKRWRAHLLFDGDRLEARTWSRLTSEPSGLVELARVNGLRDGKNPVFARTVIRSARAQTKRLDFGFSDRAVVYLNGQALYRGDDTYRSRDYRFLGSIDYYDTLYLPLAEGDNELVVVVSEDLGGWGVQAKLADPAELAFE
jgi:hypothetical protein